jgi:hypothetical protein
MFKLCNLLIKSVINSCKLINKCSNCSHHLVKIMKKLIDFSLFITFTSAFKSSSSAASVLNWRDNLMKVIEDERMFTSLTLFSFLSLLCTSLNSITSISSSFNLARLLFTCFKLSSIEINNHSVDTFLMQSWIMCIKCAWVFHNEIEMYNYNIIFYNKIMYWKYDHCRSKKAKKQNVLQWIFSLIA